MEAAEADRYNTSILTSLLFFLAKTEFLKEALQWVYGAHTLSSAGIDRVGLDGTLYDQVLDFIFYLGLAPKRFQVPFIPRSL